LSDHWTLHTFVAQRRPHGMRRLDWQPRDRINSLFWFLVSPEFNRSSFSVQLASVLVHIWVLREWHQREWLIAMVASKWISVRFPLIEIVILQVSHSRNAYQKMKCSAELDPSESLCDDDWRLF
jgi:hypothetical protein